MIYALTALAVWLLLPPVTYAQSSLRLVSPNGGEQLTVGTSNTIRWDGVPASTSVNLEYSTTGGSTWTLITPAATGLQYQWTVPLTPSTQCRMRASVKLDTILLLGQS